MTNEQIIMQKSVELMKRGVLACAGTMECVSMDGESIEVDMPEQIHTVRGWNELGFKVRKGEHAIAKFAIWSASKKKPKDDDEQPTTELHMRNASWFKESQVERSKSLGQ